MLTILCDVWTTDADSVKTLCPVLLQLGYGGAETKGGPCYAEGMLAHRPSVPLDGAVRGMYFNLLLIWVNTLPHPPRAFTAETISGAILKRTDLLPEHFSSFAFLSEQSRHLVSVGRVCHAGSNRGESFSMSLCHGQLHFQCGNLTQTPICHERRILQFSLTVPCVRTCSSGLKVTD